MDKAQMRQEVRKQLVALSDRQRDDSSKKACQNLVNNEQFKQASVVMLYLSLPHEIDVTPAILHAWQQEKTVAVPKVSWQQRHMIPVEINSLETGLSGEAGGLKNPITGVPVPLEDIDLVVTPGLAFDKKGNRLGRGGSYYDKFFDAKQLRASKCGFAFGQQVVESIPVDKRDKPVDFLVTDQGVIQCK
jgi:5-formyltetrahydrofolate cyclo-ligase